MKVLVTGGTGFIGMRIVHALRAHDRDVRVLVRRPERAARVAAWKPELATGDVTDAGSLKAALDGCTHVIHLVSIIKGSRDDFERIMIHGTNDLIAAAQEQGVERFVLMSSLGVDPVSKDVVPYYGAKWAMEQAVAASGLPHTIFRPSFVFGQGGALPTFISQVRLLPVVTVIGSGRQRLQPIWVDDVAEYFARSLEVPEALNRTFELGGPDVVDWDGLYLAIAKAIGKKRRLAHIPIGLARAGARATQWLPGAPVTTDQIAMIEAGDNIASNNDAVETFKLPLVALEEQLRRVA
ncbi:MAG TPA: NAD-dependent epimerase/dehydratase family protein [Gaiellaceae bacterium]|nr:NAD-dependent epimerase/dehydratase family protein [Gaiellaceae bacterium]